MEKELLHRFFDGRASVEEEKQVLDWIDRDPANRRELLAERDVLEKKLAVLNLQYTELLEKHKKASISP